MCIRDGVRVSRRCSHLKEFSKRDLVGIRGLSKVSVAETANQNASTWEDGWFVQVGLPVCGGDFREC